ncbi:MAG: alpha-ribazole phosphatase [Gammaproteobacteria bacterium]|nr:alpha-ribazole phosphatase [Gammaproteobacteria bacterium]MCP5460061.1 alpha-ribazole phosphatase [Gammaproteobacteria bacterium]
MSDDLITVIDLLRHGEPEGGRRYRGSLDDPLSASGWEQMRAAIHLCQPTWQVIVSSPLRRCAEFAQELADRHRLPLEIDSGLREMSFGVWEGRTPAEILLVTPEAQERFWRDPIRHPPPDGENLLSFQTRVVSAWHDLLGRHTGRRILLVGHGGMIRIVLCHILEIPLRRLWRLEVPYANLSRIRVHGQGDEAEPTLQFHGQGLKSVAP